MTKTLAARPAPLSRVWSGSKVIAEDLDGGDLADVLELHSDASAWWVLDRRPEEVGPQLRDVAGALDLDRLAIADLVAEDRRVKFEQLGHSRLVVTSVVALDRSAVAMSVYPISLVVTDRALICLTGDDSGSFNAARRLTSAADLLADGGISRALQLVLAAVIDTYEETVDWLEGSSDDLAESLRSGQPLSADRQVSVLRLRTVLSDLRRLTEPMRLVMAEVVDSYAEDAGTVRPWRALAERHDRVASAADELREDLSSVSDTSLALSNARINQTMERLTGWAAIIAVPTLVTGFVGMNVEFPLAGTVAGFWLYCLIMVTAVVGLYVLFRRKDWI